MCVRVFIYITSAATGSLYLMCVGELLHGRSDNGSNYLKKMKKASVRKKPYHAKWSKLRCPGDDSGLML